MKLILTDIDDCLLQWSHSFTEWVVTQGHPAPELPLEKVYVISKWLNIHPDESEELVHRFNSSSGFQLLTPYAHAKEVVNRLHSKGWKFIAISAVHKSRETWKYRQENLDVHFPGIFEVIIHSGFRVTERKKPYLELFKPAIWIEDSWSNAVDGADVGHKTFIMSKSYNEDKVDSRITRVQDWYDIEKAIC